MNSTLEVLSVFFIIIHWLSNQIEVEDLLDWFAVKEVCDLFLFCDLGSKRSHENILNLCLCCVFFIFLPSAVNGWSILCLEPPKLLSWYVSLQLQLTTNLKRTNYWIDSKACSLVLVGRSSESCCYILGYGSLGRFRLHLSLLFMLSSVLFNLTWPSILHMQNKEPLNFIHPRGIDIPT